MSPGYGIGLYGTEVYGDPLISVRELPPLRTHTEAITPTGRHYRWGEDEPNPANVPSGTRSSSTMPGGYETFDTVLPRKPGIDYSDLQRLTQIREWGAGGDLAWEGRLERAPRVSGDQMAVSPSAVGYQAHLDDDKSASMVYIDASLQRWSGPSSQRRLILIAASFNPMDPAIQSDQTTGVPAIEEGFDDNPWTTAGEPAVEALYDAGPSNSIGRLLANWVKGGNVDSTNVNWTWDARLATTDTLTSTDSSGNLRAAGPGTVDLSATTTRRFASLRHLLSAANTGASGKRFAIYWSAVRVIGNHGLPLQALTGLLASDVVTHAVTTWAPMLTITSDSVQPSTFSIPHLTFPDSTTASDIIRQASRFGLQDWAVWNGPTFWWYPRGMFGRNWRARIGPAQLEETGPQVDRLWNSVTVQYQDVDGSMRTAGPPGSGADTEDAVLLDTDPDNPANLLGITRRELLTMGTSTAAGATEIGRRFLEESKQLDRSGRARFVGHVMDDRGILRPYWKVRAGDTVTFVDASDPSPRRIVKAEHDRATRTCTVDLDAPPDGLQALLERLGVALVPLGF